MSATVSTPVEGRWLPILLSGRPHQVISNHDAPYLRRWYLIPRNRWLNLYLHHFVGSDDPRGLHDHPWWFASLVLVGSYIEVTATGCTHRRGGSVAVRRATHRHRVCLPTDRRGREIPCWSLVVTGPHLREWGFWCPRHRAEYRFIPWHQFGAGGCAEPDTRTRR